jgi:hypothetical protein
MSSYTEKMADIATMLAADGYNLAVEENGHRVELTVSPGADACEDCLVPKDLMRGILSQQLGIDGGMIDIAYPVDLPGYSGSAGAH